MTKRRSESVPKAMQPVFEDIAGRIEAVCKSHLNQEYAQLGRAMAAALARKRPSPLSSGKPQTWACAIVYALGRVNFLFDASQKPHLKATELCEIFDVSPGTASAKSKTIWDLFKMVQLDPNWTLPSKLDQNPLAWMISVNGFILDARSAPRRIQEEAFRLGLIPHLPEPRGSGPQAGR
jgi:hypothetical protein